MGVLRGVRKVITKSHEKSLGGDVYVHYFGWDYSFMDT